MCLFFLCETLSILDNVSCPPLCSRYRTLTGFRTRYPQMWHCGVLTMLSWRNLRNNRRKKISDLPQPFSLERGHKTLRWERHPPLSPRRWDAKKHPNKQVLQSFPQFITVISSPLLPLLFLHNFPLFIKASIKTLKFNYCFKSSFSYESSCVT